MRELVKGLEQRVEAQEEQIEHQGGILQDAQKVVRDHQKEEEHFQVSASSGRRSTSTRAWRAATPGTSTTRAAAGVSQRRHQFRQQRALLPVPPGSQQLPGRPGVVRHREQTGTEESRAGFHTTILYGTTASFLGQAGITWRGTGVGRRVRADRELFSSLASRLDQRLLRPPGVRELPRAARRGRQRAVRKVRDLGRRRSGRRHEELAGDARQPLQPVAADRSPRLALDHDDRSGPDRGPAS